MSKSWEADYFVIFGIRSGYHHISIHPDLKPKATFTCPYGKFQEKQVACSACSVQTMSSVFLNLMFKLFFKYLDSFLVIWMDDLLIYSQTEKRHLQHKQFVFKKFQGVGIKLDMSKCEFFRCQIEYLGHLVSGYRIVSMKWVEAIMDLVPATNITEKHYVISLFSYYRKFYPVFSNMV